MRTDKCAILSVPNVPYKYAIAIKNNDDDITLIAIYLSDSTSCRLVAPSVNKTYDASNITSNVTNKLNKSPVKKEPFTPAIKKWINGYKYNFSRSLPMVKKA